MDKGIIYYSDGLLKDKIALPVQKLIAAAELPIVSVTLKPMDFGKNFVLDLPRGYPTLVQQIIKALEESTSKYVFFCEHDVLYHKSHFDFTPPDDEHYFYNLHNWRWHYPYDRVVTYNQLISLSGLCCNRMLVLRNYYARWEWIKIKKYAEDNGHDAGWCRGMGYEPGTKRIKGFPGTNEILWMPRHSEFPNIDIRHRGTFSKRKIQRKDFITPVTGWREGTFADLSGWDAALLRSIA